MSGTPFLDISAPLQKLAQVFPAVQPEAQRHAVFPLAPLGAAESLVPPSSGKPLAGGMFAPSSSPEGLAGSPLSRAEMVFEAAVKAVQKTLKHLSEEAIRFPPKNMPDATLAAQIALHVVVTRTMLSRPHLRHDIRRSASAIGRAEAVISGRLADETFAAAYRQITADTDAFLDAMEDTHV